ncbi:EAL domain-containing protein [Oribacterium sp. WCC10]|uniref:EAL domain-containing protein n=1 Tax=Oribacterium sp. WCC10 TaxID=1855343 RepID=UPI000B812C22|nr:EAL domain-containing protein [Oribacterium sp. WCC10]
MNQKYRFSDEKLREIESSDVAYAVYQVVDKRVVTLALSGGFIEMFEVPKEKLYAIMDKDMFINVHPDDLARCQNDAYYFAIHPEETYSTSYRIKLSKDDYYVILRSQGKHKTMEDGTDVCIVWYTKSAVSADEINLRANVQEKREIDLLRKENSLIKKTYYDVLTGLPNMIHFLQLADTALMDAEKEGRSFTMMAFDLIGMKYFNSKYGLDEGDRLLYAFADILRHHFGNESSSRFGEDHFYAFTTEENVEDDLNNVFTELKSANDGKNLPVKVGIYKYSKHDLPISTICDRAKMASDHDNQAYVSKFVYFNEEMRIAVNKRDYVLQHLDQALEEKWIQVYYQPIMRAVTGLICNEEALARWIDPKLGMISPGDFIPIIEEAKLLYKLDLYVIDQVLEYIKKYRDGSVIHVVPVSVNISRYDFVYCDMVSEILKRVEKSGVSPRYLVIEITESVMEMDLRFILEQINRLQKNGFKVWMDDFGSGYSSLNVLKNFDFDLIKLDMKFMRDFGKNVKNEGIVRKIIEMAEQLGVDTLAEGVETEEQLEFLKDIGCDKVQGFLYSAPNPLDEIIKRNKLGIGLHRENIDEAEFYDLIGQASLMDAEINGDAGMLVSETFAGIGIGILEYDGAETYRLMRANTAYKEYVSALYEREIKVTDSMSYSKLDRDRIYEKSVKRCLKSGNWETAYDIAFTNEYKLHTNTRIFAQDKVTGAYALLVVITSEKRIEAVENYEYAVPPVQDLDLQTERAMLERSNVMDNAIIRIAKHLNTFEDYNVSMNHVLMELSNVISPDRICIFEKVENRVTNSFEWCRKGIMSQKEFIGELEYEKYFKVWVDMSEEGRAVIIDNIAQLKLAARDVYYQLRWMGVKRIIMAPVYSKDEIIGFIGAENYRLDEAEDTEFILSSVSVFLSFRIANSTLVHRLVYMADHDSLTSAHNRNAMIKKEAEFSAGEGSVGIVFIDINGLKETNDNFGHDEGDMLIIRAAKLISKHFGIEHLYRAGGDEFVVMMPDVDRYQFERKQYQFLQDLNSNDKINMASGFVWIPDRKNISEGIKEADRLMYEDKAKYYMTHDRRHKTS